VSAEGSSPLVSVVIPTHARPAALDTCLAALATQTLDAGRFDVVVVDDGSPTPLDDVLDRHSSSLRLTLHRQERSGAAAARNAGAAASRAPLLAFTDDDCAPTREWLEAMVAALRRTPDTLIGGLTVNALTANPYAEASQSLLTYLCAEGFARSNGLGFFASNNLGIARDAFAEVGGFDGSFPGAAGEDRDLCDRWQAQGRPLRLEPSAVVRHAHEMGLRGFLRQHAGYGRGAQRLHRARVRRGQPRLRVESPGFYEHMLRHPFRHLPTRRAVQIAGLIAVSQIATAAGFVLEARPGQRRRIA
jgi:GT2 family glycosyltransferase